MSLPWNTDWEALVNSSPSGMYIFNEMATNAEYIKPFVNAINERALAVGYKQIYQTSVPDGLPRSPYNTYSFTGDLVHHPLASGQDILYQPISEVNLIEVARLGYLPGYEGFQPPMPSSVPLHAGSASGCSWPALQSIAIMLSKFFLKNVDGFSYVRPSGHHKRALYVEGNGMPRRYPEGSGIRGLSPMSVHQGMTLHPTIGATFWGNNTLSMGSRNYLPASGTWYVRDKFPNELGFRRKFPREIWTLDLPYGSGVDGQIARFTTRYEFNQFIPGFVGPTRWDSTTIYDPVYGSGVLTPEKYRHLSGKIMQYSAASGTWLVHPDQYTNPDIIETYGLMRPGDYFGPWILNDLRDALNEMHTTWGWLWGGGSMSPTDFQNSVTTRYGYHRRGSRIINQISYRLQNIYYEAYPSFWLFTEYWNKGYGLFDGTPPYAEECLGDPDAGYPPYGSDWSSYIECVWDHTPVGSAGQGLYSMSVLPHKYAQFDNGSDIDSGTFFPDPPSGYDPIWTIGASVTYCRVKPSGHEFANNRLTRTYKYYLASTPVEGTSSLSAGDTIFDKMGDAVGNYSPPSFTGTMEHRDDEYSFEEVGSVTCDKFEDGTMLIGDSSLSFPGYTYAGSARGYEGLDLIAICEWDFQYT